MIAVNQTSRWLKRQGSKWATAELPMAYPYSNSYVTTPSAQRILNPGNNQAGDPRASGSSGGASWSFSPSSAAQFFPNAAPIGGSVLNPPGSNVAGLSTSNLVVMALLGFAVFLLFFRRA